MGGDLLHRVGERNYRQRLAVIHGCSEWAVTSTLMRDLGLMRNDFAHNRGIAGTKQKRCNRLPWFQPGDAMQPKQRDYEQLLAEFETEREVLTRAPKPYKTNRVELKGQVPQDVIDRFSETSKTLGIGSDEALEMALAEWLERND